MLTLLGCHGGGLGKTALHSSTSAVEDIEVRPKFRSGSAGELTDGAAPGEVPLDRVHVLCQLRYNLQRLLTPAGVNGPLANSNANAKECWLAAMLAAMLAGMLASWLASWLSCWLAKSAWPRASRECAAPSGSRATTRTCCRGFLDLCNCTR